MLIVATRERDMAIAQIESLRSDLALFLSVPAEGKPCTAMMRVGRMPLVVRIARMCVRPPVAVGGDMSSGSFFFFACFDICDS